jgi:hypothetical protein
MIKERWGSGVVEQLSLDMQRDFSRCGRIFGVESVVYEEMVLFLHAERGCAKTATAC